MSRYNILAQAAWLACVCGLLVDYVNLIILIILAILVVPCSKNKIQST